MGVVMVMTLFGCTGITGKAIASEEVVIGGVFHLTGPAAFWGNGERNAAMLAVEEINGAGGVNGRAIRLIVEDGQTDFVVTNSVLQKLIHVNNVEVIVGPTWFGQAAAPIAEQEKIVIVSPSTGVTVSREKYFFNLWPTERQEIEVIVSYMVDSGVKKVAVVYSKNDWSLSMKDNFIDECGLRGISIIRVYGVSPDTSDFRTIITQMKILDIDAVYGAFAFYPSQGQFSVQRKELGLDKVLYSTSGTENPELLKAFPAIEGTIYPYPQRSSKEEAFWKRYEKRFGMVPAPSVAYAYDAVYVVAEALENDLETYLEGIDFDGVSNRIVFENGRVVQKEHLVKSVENGEFVIV